MSTITREALWTRLREASLVEGDPPTTADAPTPWFVRVMLGIAGWIGALFLVGFVSVGLAFARSSEAYFVMGALACAAASVMFHLRPKGDFVAQFGLAVSLAGQILIAVALFDWFGKGGGRSAFERVALALALEQAVLFALVPNFIHRVWTAWSGAYAATFAFKAGSLAVFMPAALSAACLAAWVFEFSYPRRNALLRAAGYGLALGALQSVLVPSARP